MTDPKELNTIDKLFRDTFSSLPDSPAPDGWDTPSEHVWMRIRRETGTSPVPAFKGSRWMLAALTVGIVVAGMYLFSSAGDDVPQTDEKSGASQPVNQTIAVEPQAVKENGNARVSATTVPGSIPAVRGRNNASATIAGRQITQEDTEMNRMKGAAPLPGTAKPVAPNTTEERRAVLEQLWRTPLDMLPVPRR